MNKQIIRCALLYLFIVPGSLMSSVEVFAIVAGQQLAATYAGQLQHLLTDLNRSVKTSDNIVTVILETSDLNTSIHQQVKNHGGKFHFHSGKRHEMRITAKKLQQLITYLPQNVHVRLPYPHQAVSVTSQGVALTGAIDTHSLGNGGAGVKVGIIDLGFASYTTSQASGDLPAVLSIVDYTGTGTGGINHGTSVAEIVHDMAPGASLYLAKVGTSLQLEQAMNDMTAAGVKIINHSVAWFGAAFYDGTGPICAITDNADLAGMQWINAMGNSRTAHYLGTFTDTNGDLRHEFSAGVNSNTVSLTAGGTVTLILNWDNYASADVDYNLYLYDADPAAGGNLVASSQDAQTGRRNSPAPYEAITYTATTTATHYIVVSKTGSSVANLPLSLFSTGPALGVKTYASSITQPADCNSVIGVGATNLTDGVEYFSSEGPTTDGRNKPEISAPNRTVTSLTDSFAGTSGASPHAAGAAALLLAQNPALTPAALRAKLIADTHDVSAGGFDYRTGYGRISMDADQDGYNHDADNCVLLANVDQLDTDLDTQGNVCDADDDNDGLTDDFEILIGTDTLLADSDGDNLSDYFEVSFDNDISSYLVGFDLNPLLMDSDGDGLSDYAELAWDGVASAYLVGADLNPLSVDTDGDGLLDSSDPIPLYFNYADGDIAPLGAPDGVVDIADYVVYQRILQNNYVPSSLEISHGDIYPSGAPDGLIDISDLMLFQKMAL